MLCSIFMASTTHTSWPAMILSPGLTRMEMTFPDIGEEMILSGVSPVEPRGVGGATMSADWVRPRRGRAGGWSGGLQLQRGKFRLRR